MRRAAPLSEWAIKATAAKPVKGHRWRPRERRLKLATPVAFRAHDAAEWLSGHTLNLSRSGLLLLAEQFLAVDTTVEFAFDMPVEIAGQIAAKVMCRGKVARAVMDKGPQGWLLAFVINDYEFLREHAVDL